MAEMLTEEEVLGGAHLRAADAEVREMLLKLVQALVDEPEKLDLLHVADDGEVAFQVRTTAEDAGKLIGKNGRTVRAIRVILNGSGMKNGRVYTLDLLHHPRSK